MLRVGRIQQWIRLLSLCVLMGASLAAWDGGAAAFTATLEPETVAVGDTAALKFVFEGSGQIQLSQVPSIPGLVISGPRQGRSVNIVNGRRSETVTVTYYLRPTQTNEFVIPSFTARIGNKDFQSQAFRLRAVQATQSNTTRSLALLRLVVPRERLYVGENTVIELQLLLNRAVSGISDFDMPDFSGAGWETGEPMKGQQRQVQIDGQVMTLVPIRIPLTPLSPGELRLGPVNSGVVVQTPAQRRRDDPFGAFDFGLFQRTEGHRVPLTLPAHTVEAVPLPNQNVPHSFTGAVGQFDMTVSVGPTNLTVGDPITLRVQISGTGNLNSFSLPQPLVKGDFKTYEPERKLDTTDDFGFTGLKTVEQILIPENTEVREVPPIEFSFFDPTSGHYRTLQHPATPLRVRPAGSRPAPVVSLAGQTHQPEAARHDIVHIKQRLDEPAPTGSGPALGPRFYLTNAAPLLAWLGVLVWRKRTDALGRNPRLRRKQAVRRVIAQGLNELRHLSKAGEAEAFFATVFRLLQEQIGVLLDQPASGITESVVDEKLSAQDIDAGTLATLHELFQACNLARYAPTHDSQQLTAFLPKLEEALSKLAEVQR